MTLPAGLLSTTCDIYRPFGATQPLVTGVPCQLVSDLEQGRPRGNGGLLWTHYLLVEPSVDLRDGCSRTAGTNAVTYADGDKVLVPAGSSNTRYVVVWVEYVQRGHAKEYKRAYLLRDLASWPGP
jgi:hypothetical protein